MFRFSKAKKKLQEAAVNKFFPSWLRGWCDGIVRGLVPKKPKHRRLRGDWSLKNLNNTVDSSEKVSFRVDMQCSSLRAEAFLVLDSGSQPTLGQQITDMLPTVGRQSADCWQKIFIKGGKWQLADCWWTVDQQIFGGAVLHFFHILNKIVCLLNFYILRMLVIT